MAKIDLIKQQIAMAEDLRVGKQPKKKSPIVKPVGAPIPQKGDAVDRLTSYMETDVGTGGTTPYGGNQSAPNPSAPRVSGIIPTTSNSISSPVSATVAPAQSAPVPMQTAPTAPAQTAPVAPAPAEQPTIQELIDQMNEARRQSQIASLEKARDQAISNLEGEQAGLAPQYYDARNRAAAQSDISAMNFAQHMASRGVKGGAGGMPEIYRNSALQGNIGALDRQEQSAIDAIARDRTGVLNSYEQDVVSANADIDAQGLQAYIDQMNADRTFGLQEGGLTGTYNGAPTLQAQQYEFERGIQEGGLTGMYKGSPTLQKQMHEADMTFRNKQLAIDSAYKNGQLSLQRAQQAQASAKFEYQKKQDDLDRQYQQEQFAYGKEQDALNRQDKLATQSASSQSNAQKTILDTAKGMESIHNMTNLTSTEKYNLAKKMGYID